MYRVRYREGEVVVTWRSVGQIACFCLALMLTPAAWVWLTTPRYVMYGYYALVGVIGFAAAGVGLREKD